MLKLSKCMVVIAVALFFSITVFNNVIDYEKTFVFTYHTLSMDTTAQNPHFMGRAITNIVIQHAVFLSIILTQSVIALLCWTSLALMIREHKRNDGFIKAKNLAVFACCLGFILYGLGFMTLAGQWFMMRESSVWNVQNSIHLFLTFLGFSMMYLYFPDSTESQ